MVEEKLRARQKLNELKIWQKGTIFGISIGILKIFLGGIPVFPHYIFRILVFFALLYGITFYIIDRVLDSNRKQEKAWKRQLILGLVIVPIITGTYLNTQWYLINVLIILPWDILARFLISIFIGILMTPFLLGLGYVKQNRIRHIIWIALLIIYLGYTTSGYFVYVLLWSIAYRLGFSPT